MNSCSWFSIEARDLVGTSRHGTLYRVRSRDWASDHPDGDYEKRRPRRGGEESTSYVFCSKRKAAVMFPNGQSEKSEIIRLAPGNLLAISGATEYANMYYLAVCHKAGPKSERDIVELGKRLGYDISAESASLGEYGKPSDLLKP